MNDATLSHADLGALVLRLQSHYLRGATPRQVFDALLPDLLALTGSVYGMISEVEHDGAGVPFLRVLSMTDLSWDTASSRLVESSRSEGLEFHRLDTLLGRPLIDGQPLIANDPAHDPRRGGLPPGHPAIATYLGAPLHHGGELVGQVGLANRPGGYDTALLGALQPLLATVASIIGLVRAERALRRSEQRWRSMVEMAGVGIAQVDIDGRFVDANPRHCQILGRPLEELRRLHFQDLTHPDDLAQDLAMVQELLAGRRDRFTMDKRYLRPDGTAVWTQLSVGLLRDEQGRPLQFVSTVEELTERREAQQALQASERRLRKLTDNVDGAFYLARIDTQGRMSFVYASRGLWRLWQVPEAKGMPAVQTLMAFIDPQDIDEVQRHVQRLLDEAGTLNIVYRVHLPDGVHWHEAQGVAEREDDGGILLHGFTFDITERLRYQQAMTAAESARRANAAKTEFLSRMSHELRTPLNAVLGFAQLLQMDDAQPMSDAQRTRVAHIERAGAHLLAMINDVLDLSRIEAGTMPLTIEPLPVAPLLDEALALVVAQAQQAGVVLEPPEVEADAAVDLAVDADRVRLRQVLVNLLSNAVKYNRAGGRVRLTARRENAESAEICLAVADTGIGLSPQQLEHLWEPFNRLGAERTSVEGTGIGLALSQRMVQMMAGRIEVASEHGVGSTFTVCLPAAQAAPAGRSAGPEAQPAFAGPKKRKVIYAEDDPLNVELVQQLFQLRPQLRLRVARSGAEALALARREPPDLLLLDMHLGDMDGLQVREQLAAEGIAPICVALSADVMPERVERALAAGFADYLPKPLDVAALMRCMDRLLGAPSQFAGAWGSSQFGELR